MARPKPSRVLCSRNWMRATKRSSPPRSGPKDVKRASRRWKNRCAVSAAAHRPHAGSQPARLAHATRHAARLESAPADSLYRRHALHVECVRGRSQLCCAPRGPTSCRSTTPRTTATPKRASCRSPPNGRCCDLISRSAAAACWHASAKRRCLRGRRKSAARAGRRFCSNSCWAARGDVRDSGHGASQYMADNVRAGSGPLPDRAMCERIVATVNG